MNRPAAWTAGQARAALAAAPVVGLAELCPRGDILVVAPHPDDESLGCGGLIATAAAAGRGVRVAILTDGAASHPGSVRAPPHGLARLRRREARQALRRLTGGRLEPATLGAPDGALAAHRDAATDWLAALACEGPVASIFAPWEADPHPDHQAAFRIAQTVAAAVGATLLRYPVWGLTLHDAAPCGRRSAALSLDIAPVLDLKRRAIAAHRSQTTGLIPDAPDAFRLSSDDLARHLQPSEPYLLG